MLAQLFDLEDIEGAYGFMRSSRPWEWIAGLDDHFAGFMQTSSHPKFRGVIIDETKGNVVIEDGAIIRTGAVIYGPTFIGQGAVVGHNALLFHCLVMERCSIGHCVEVKHSILLPGATCGHRNYVGDSVLGRDVNMGDGSGIANLRADRDPEKTVKVTWNGEKVDTGLRKFGALVGDGSSLGCRSTLNPGTILGKGCLVMPNTVVKGTHAPRMLLSSSAELVAKPR